MITALIFDTCVLPQRRGLSQNPLLSALLRIARLRGYEVYVSEVVKIESLAERQRVAEAVLESLRTAIRAAAKVFNQLDYYLPSEADAVGAWDRELSESFQVLPLDGADAIEALHREARRRAPARATPDGSAVGSRDAAIWLSAKRLHLSQEDRETWLISSNTTDFADQKDRHRLRAELAEELGDSVSRFAYLPSVGATIDRLAEPTEIREIDEDQLRRLVESGDLVNLVQDAAIAAAPPDPGRMHIVTMVMVDGAREIRAYKVEDTRLAMVSVPFAFVSVVGKGPIDEGIRSDYEGRARIWVYETEGGGTLSVEFESIESFGTSELPTPELRARILPGGAVLGEVE